MCLSFQCRMGALLFLCLLLPFTTTGMAAQRPQAEKFQEQLQRALDLGSQSPPTPQTISEIQLIFSDLERQVRDKGRNQGFFEFFKEVVEQPTPYDGTIDNLVKWLRFLSVAGDGRIDLMTEELVIPCERVLKHPDLKNVSEPVFGSSMDLYFPRTDCAKFRKRLPQSLMRYAQFIDQFSGDYRHEGTIRFAHARSNALTWDRIALFPNELSPAPQAKDCRYPLEKWALMSPWNWQKFQKSKTLFQQAERDMTRYYQAHHHMMQGKSEQAARKALWAQAFEGQWDEITCLNNSLRHALLTGQPAAQIIQKITDGSYQLDEWEKGLPTFNPQHPNTSIWFYSEKQDPLLHFAVFHTDMLAYFLEQNIFSQQTNEIGKTALMTAAQFDKKEALRLLLEKGANPNVTTRKTTEYLRFNARTALMYAAENASQETIDLLVQYGANLKAKDSEGGTVQDYAKHNPHTISLP